MLYPRFKSKMFNNSVEIHQALIDKTVGLHMANYEYESQSQIDATQGQEQCNLSRFSASNTSKGSAHTSNDYTAASAQCELFDIFSDEDNVMPNISTNLEDKVKVEFQNYLSYILNLLPNQKKSYDPIAWWKENYFKFPYLFKMFKHYLIYQQLQFHQREYFPWQVILLLRKEQLYHQTPLIC